MRRFNLFAPIIAIAIVSALFSCVDSDKNFYDSSYRTPNPMGDEFVAPNGFDWSTTTTTTVNVEADNEDAQYYSLVEVLDANPFSTPDYNVLAKGTAKPGQAFSQEVIYPQGITYLYIRKTDPRGRVAVNTLAVGDKQDLSVKTVRALKASTRSNEIPEKYPEESYDTTGAIELVGGANWNQDNHHLEGGKSYIIKNSFTGNINDNSQYSGIFTLFVESEWTPPHNMIQNANIIVLKGGKLNISNFDSFLIGDNSTLTIQSGGSLVGNDLKLARKTLMKNFGTVNVNSMKNLNSNCTLYNAHNASIVITGKSIGSQESTVCTTGLISNFGEFTIQDGALKLNSEDGMQLFYNGDGAVVNTPTFIIGGIGTNDGTINALKIINVGNPTFTNNCNLYAKESFNFSETNGRIIMNKGILAGGIKDDNFIAVPSFVCGNSGSTFELNNGSMIKAKVITIPGVNIIAGSEGTRSLLKATESVTTGWTTQFKGNLDIECPEGEFAKGVPSDNPNYTMEKSVVQYSPNGSKTIITSCSEITEVPDPGTAPKDPQFPIKLEDNRKYSYLFEDQWPLYGDYDMNDIVMTIKKRKLDLSEHNNKVEEFELEIELSAVGATKKIGAAIMFDGVLASDITEEVDFDDDDDDNTLIKNFNLNNYNIEKGQKYAVVPLFDDAHKALGRDRYIQINTISGHSNNVKKTKTISFSIEFDKPTLSADAFNINKLNVFIITGGNGTNRREIHVAGYQPTQLADVSSFGGNDDASSLSSKKYYLSKENLAWGIIVPTNFKWPLEYVNIKTAYNQFNDWVTSGGAGNKNWWNDWDKTKVFQTNKN
ncbi:LruC domain-containing protein [Bacteroides bouchesdurhonensis]|uniref:LruC domain-containing protein n=1 Tax=Bacteroides bouchesdurhonensis TaxID=1841855 RepID=UPI0011DCCBE2|nr:LruC domain-containing protein [Bacteroides bouchesdurhonensis]